MTVDLNTTLDSFRLVFWTVLDWLKSIDWVIGSIHFNLYDLTIAMLALELIWWFVTSNLGFGVADFDEF